ncbi:MAG: glycosyltransferase, partial [Leptospiraceae bacterium]|nr:glycosyltransferase [Leptospiraceae bacterium]
MNGKPIRVLVVAGGTGGHIVPGIALAAEFQHKGHAVHFLTLERNRNFGD